MRLPAHWIMRVNGGSSTAWKNFPKTARLSPLPIVFLRSNMLMRSLFSRKMELQSVEPMSFSCKKAEFTPNIIRCKKNRWKCSPFPVERGFFYTSVYGYEEIIYNAEICAISTKKTTLLHISKQYSLCFCDKYLT